MFSNSLRGSHHGSLRRSLRARPLGRVLAAVVALSTAATVASAAPAPQSPQARQAQSVKASSVLQTTPATFFRAASFNVLGADHTAPGGNRKGWESGVVRMDRVVTLLGQQELDVVGFQEFQPPSSTFRLS